ncbi:MAG: hypothetical protein ACHP8A_04040 [Terriglobales bacterium]|jgi:peroxiredoxin|nr:hypothetical protein [Terriglobales bacterium]
MRKSFMGIAAAALLVALSVGVAPQQLQAETKEPIKLKVGDMAPNFTLLAFDGAGLKKISLEDYRGKKNVALAFYVFAFTGG